MPVPEQPRPICIGDVRQSKNNSQLSSRLQRGEDSPRGLIAKVFEGETFSQNVKELQNSPILPKNIKSGSAHKALRQPREGSFAKEYSSPVKEGSLKKISASQIEAQQHAQMVELVRKNFMLKTKGKPMEKRNVLYDSVNFCHHFDEDDHQKLGYDLGIVFFKYLVRTEDQEESVEQITQKYLYYLHGKAIQAENMRN
mmetsp:Transcript_1691/g.2984  ORF Transcript_1691/g.2984 Transcript_1691/m.2984 type:complete len:198 (+) Transcript_1691:321-914(+)